MERGVDELRPHWKGRFRSIPDVPARARCSMSRLGRGYEFLLLLGDYRLDATLTRAEAADPIGDEDEADEISAVILPALREANAKDYTDWIIERVERSFSPSAALRLIAKRTVFVATVDSRVVGTASLERNSYNLRRPRYVQAQGIGKLLIAEIERAAPERNIAMLAVPPRSRLKRSTPGSGSGPYAVATMVMNARLSWSDCWMSLCKSG